MEKNDKQQMGPLSRSKRFQDTIQVNSSAIVTSDKIESIFFTVTSRRDQDSSPETGSGKGTRSGNSRLLFPTIPDYSLYQKKNGKLRLVIDISLLNLYIKKQPFKMETVKSVKRSIVNNRCLLWWHITDI